MVLLVSMPFSFSGQLAGCYYGFSGIPTEWTALVTYRSLIQVFADELFHLSEHVVTSNSAVDVPHSEVYWQENQVTL